MATDPFAFYRTGVRAAGLGLREENQQRKREMQQLAGQPAGLTSQPNASLQAPLEDAPDPSEDERSILRKTGDAALDTVGGVGNVLDLPASVGRDLLTLLPGGPAPANPFDQLLPTNWTKSENRTSGIELLEGYGLIDKDAHPAAKFAAGLTFEVLTDPLTYFSAGGTAALKGGTKGAMAARSLKKTGLLDNVDLFAKGGKMGRREALLKSSADDVLGSDLLTKAANKPGEADEILSRVNKEFEEALRSDKSFKKATKGMSDSQVNEFIEQVRGSALSQGYMRMGAFGKGFNFGDRFAPVVDSALGKIRYSRPVVDAAARMSKAYEGKTTAESQKAVRKFMLEQQGAFINARGKMYENIRVLDPLLNSFGDLKGDDLVNAKNEVGLHMVRYLEDIGRPRMDVDLGEGLTGKASEFFDSRDEMFSQSRSDYRDSFLRDLEERVASDAPENSLVTQDIYDRVKAALSPVDGKESVLDDIKDQLDGLIVESRRFQDISQLQDEFATYFPRQRQTSRGILTGSKGSGAKAFDPENPFSIKREDKYRDIAGGTEALNRMSIDPQFAGIYSKRALNATKPNAEEKAAKLRKFASKYFSLDIADGDTPPNDVVELFGSITQRDLFDVQRGVTMFSTNPGESALKAIETAYKARAQAEMMRSVVRDTMEVVPTPSGRFNTAVRTTFGVGAESEEAIKASNVLGRKLGAALRTGEEAVSSKFKFGRPDDGPGGSGRGAGIDPDGGSGGGSGQIPDGGSGLDNLDTGDAPATDPVPATGALTDEEFKEAVRLFEDLPTMSDEEAFGYEDLVRRMLDGDGADRDLAEQILDQRPSILDESLRLTDDADVNFNTAVQISENMEQMGDEIFQYEDLFKTLMDGDAAEREIVGNILSRMLDADEESAAFADRVLGSRTDILDVSSVARGEIPGEVGDVVTDAVDDVADEASEGLPYNPLLDGDRDEIIRLLASDQAEESLSGLNRDALRKVSAASGLGIKSNSSDKLRRGLIDAARKASKEADAPAPTMSAMSVAEIAGTQDRNAGNLLAATGLFRGKVDDSGYTVFLPDEVKAQMTEGDEPLVLTRGLNEAQTSGADQQVRDLIRKLSNNPRPATQLSSDADTGKLVFRSDDSKSVSVPSRIVETIRSYHPEAEFFVTDYVRGAGDRRPHVVARVGEDFVGNIEADLLQSSAESKADSIKASTRSDFPKSMSSASAGKIAESAIRKYLRNIPADRADSLQRSAGKVGSVLGRIKSMVSQVAKAKQWERSNDVFGTGERSMSQEARELVNQGIFDIAWDNYGQTYLALAGRKTPEWLTLTNTDRARMALPNPPGVETVKRFGGNRILNADYEEAVRLIDSLPDISDEVPQTAKVGAIPLSRINHEVDDVRDSLFEYLFEKSPTRFKALQESLMKQDGDSAKRMLLSMEKVSSPAIQSDSLAGVASKVTVDAPHRTRVLKQMSNVFGEEVAATALAVTDATARAWARGTGKSADQYYAGIKEVVSVDEVTVGGAVKDVRGKIAFDRKTGEAVITGRKDADASTAFHELAHYAQRKLGEIDPDLQLVANRAVGAKSSNWTVPQMEEFAEGFEKFLSEGVAPTPELESVYKKVKQWIIDVYRGMVGTPLENKISDDLREVYIRMQGGKVEKQAKKLGFEAQSIAEGGLEGLLSGRLSNGLGLYGMKKSRGVTEQVDKLLEQADDDTLEGIAKARVGFRLGLKPSSNMDEAFAASSIRSQAEFILGKRRAQGGTVEKGIEMPSMPNSAARDGDQLGLIDGEGTRAKPRNTIKGKGEASQVNLIGGLDQDPNQTSFLEELDGTVKESAFDDAPAAKPKAKRYKERTPDEKQRVADAIGVSRQKLASAGWKKKGKRQAKGKRFIQAEIESSLEEARDILAEQQQGGMFDAIASASPKLSPTQAVNKLLNKLRQLNQKGLDYDDAREKRGLGLDDIAQEIRESNPGAFSGTGTDEEKISDFLLSLPYKVSRGKFYLDTDAYAARAGDLDIYDPRVVEYAKSQGILNKDALFPEEAVDSTDFPFGANVEVDDDMLFQSGRGRTPEPPIVNEAGETVAEVSMPGRPFMRSPGKVFIEATNQATGEDFARVLGSVYSDHIADIDPALEARAEVLYGVVNGNWDTPFTRGTETKTSREWFSEDFAKYARGEIKPPTGLGSYMDGMLSMVKGLVAGRKTEPSSNELKRFFGELMTEPFRGEQQTLAKVMKELKHTGEVAKSRMVAMMTPDEIRQASRNALRLRVESRRASAPKNIADAEQEILAIREALGQVEPDSSDAKELLSKIKYQETRIKDLENLQAKTVDQWMEEAEQVAFEGRNSLDGVGLEVKPETLLGQVRIPTHIARDLYKLNETASYLEDDFAIGPFLKWYDGYSSVFKTGVTALHPGFHVRNFFSGWVQNALNDVHDPRYGPADPRRFYGGYPDARQLMYGKTFKEANQIEGLRMMTDEEASEQIAKELFVHGVVEQPGTYRDIPGEGAGSLSSQLLGPRPGVTESKNMLDFVRKRSPGSAGVMDSAKADNTAGRRAIDGISDAWKRVSETGRTVGDAVEFQHRAGGFIMLRRQGYSAAEAARRINLLHVDYSNLSTVEKEYLRRIIPFYSFSRGMAKYLTEELITRPAGPVGITIRAQNQARDRDVATPTYVSKGLSIPIGASDDGTRTFITGLGLMHEQPVQQIAPLLSLDPARTAFAAISNMNPVIKAPLELAFDESSFQEGVSGGVDLDDARPPVGQMLSNLMDKESGQPVRLGKTFEVLAGSSPLSRYIKTVSQMSDDRKGILGSYVAPLTGLRVTSVSPERQDAVLRERAEGYLQSIGARRFEKSYIPDDVYESMSPEDKEIADKYMRVIDRIGDRNKASRKAKSKEEKKGLVDGK